MLKKELLSSFTKVAGIPGSEGKLFLEIFLSKCAAFLKHGDGVEIEQLGTFSLKHGIIKQTFDKNIEIILFTDKNGEQIIFNIPSEKTETNPVDSYFSLSIGKNFMPFEKAEEEDLVMSHSADEKRKNIESKAENFFNTASYIPNPTVGGEFLIITEDEYQKLSFDTGDPQTDNEIIPTKKKVDVYNKSKIIVKNDNNEDDIYEQVKPVTYRFFPEKNTVEEGIIEEQINVPEEVPGQDIPKEEPEEIPAEVPDESPKKEQKPEKEVFSDDEKLLDELIVDDDTPVIEASTAEPWDFNELIDNPEEDTSEEKIEEYTSEDTFDENLKDKDILSEDKIWESLSLTKSERKDALLNEEEENDKPVSIKERKRKKDNDSVDEFYGAKKKSNKGFYIAAGLLVVILIALFAYYKMGYKLFTFNSKEPQPVVIEKKDDIPVLTNKNETTPEVKKENEKVPSLSENKTEENKQINPSVNSTTNTQIGDNIKKTAPAQSSLLDGKYSIQLSSWQSYKKAEKEVNKLTGNGYTVAVEGVKVRGEQWYRVRVYFQTQAEYDSFVKKMQ